MNDGKKITVALIVILALGLLFRLYLTSLDIRVLLPNLLSDDVFYYLKVAENIGKGVGASFDGINWTNGFHPLYALFLMFMYSLNGFGLETPVRVSLILLSLFDVLTAFVIYKILLLPSLGLNRKSALIGSFFWIFNPFIISGTFYCLETAISTFFVSLAIYSYLKTRNSQNKKSCIITGFILGVAMLARMDSAFLAVAIAVDLILQKKISKLFTIGLTAFLIVSPWFAWSYLNFGMIQQNSGAVLSFMNKFSSSTLSSIMYGMYLSLRIILMFVLSMILPLGFILLCSLLKKVELKINYKKLLLNFIILFSLFLILYYPLAVGGVTRRYYQPLLVVSAIVVGMAFKPLASLKNKTQAIFVILVIVNLLSIGVFYWLYRPVSAQSWHLELYETALWINDNTDFSDRIGGFNSGIIGYYSNRTVVNLDGVINDGAYRAIITRNLFEYIKEQDIKYLVDNENTFNAIRPFMGDEDYQANLREVYRKPLEGHEGEYIVVYEVLY